MNRKLFEKQLIEKIIGWADAVELEQTERSRIVKAIFNKAIEAFESKPEWRKWKGLSKKNMTYYVIHLCILDANNQYLFDIDNFFIVYIYKEKVLILVNKRWFKEKFFKTVKANDVFVDIKMVFESWNQYVSR